MGPPWDSIRARSSSVSWRRNSSEDCSSPRLLKLGVAILGVGLYPRSPPPDLAGSGLAPCANASQLGISKPAAFQQFLRIPDGCDRRRAVALIRGGEDLCGDPRMALANHLQSICPTGPLRRGEHPHCILDTQASGGEWQCHCLLGCL